jgi:hypothetical protein
MTVENSITEVAEDVEIRRVPIRTSSLIAYRVTEWPAMKLVTAPRTREWMDATRNRFANRCLPLLMANQAGWWVLNSHPIRVTWTGGWDPACVKIQSLDGSSHYPASGHFGEGVLTFNLPFLFRTPPGVNLHVKGPANLLKDGIQALEGVIETDWSISTFTMNWKFTRTNWPITFEKDEPICMVSPQQRGYIESFDPRVRDVRDDPQTAIAYQKWAASRSSFIEAVKSPESLAAQEKWQKHYFKGLDIDGRPAAEHQSKLELKEFEDTGPAVYPPLPAVHPHPEALDALARLGTGQVGVGEVLFLIGKVAYPYVHQYASGAHGSLLGALLCRALFPELEKEMPTENIARQWDTLRYIAFDGLAVEAAVGTFAMGCAAASDDPNVAEGTKRLWDQKLKSILPALEPEKSV